MSIKDYIASQSTVPQFILRNRRAEVIDTATAGIERGKLVVTSQMDGTQFTSFSAWRGTRTSYANTYDMISTREGLLLREIAEGSMETEVGELNPETAVVDDLTSRFAYRLYHGHTPRDYIGYMKRALTLDLERHALLVDDWSKVATRTLGEAVKGHIRFQYGLRWADKSRPCLYREEACENHAQTEFDTAMDHVIPVSELAAAVLEEKRGFDHRFATLVRAWLCPVAHISKTAHARITRGVHLDHARPFLRYAQASIIARDHSGAEVADLTLDDHFETLRQIAWVEPIIQEYIDRFTWDGTRISGSR